MEQQNFHFEDNNLITVLLKILSIHLLFVIIIQTIKFNNEMQSKQKTLLISTSRVSLAKSKMVFIEVYHKSDISNIRVTQQDVYLSVCWKYDFLLRVIQKLGFMCNWPVA